MQAFATILAAQRAALLAAAPRITETYAQTLLALVTLRVQRDGLTGKLYSNRDFPLLWFKDRALNAAGRAWLEGKKKRKKEERKSDPANWAGFRAAQGLPVDAVTLTYTGGMFRSLTIAAGSNNAGVYTARAVASDTESADKVKYNQKRYGDFLQALPGEVAQGAAYVQSETARVLRGATV